jgi:hypothetical protein
MSRFQSTCAFNDNVLFNGQFRVFHNSGALRVLENVIRLQFRAESDRRLVALSEKPRSVEPCLRRLRRLGARGHERLAESRLEF